MIGLLPELQWKRVARVTTDYLVPGSCAGWSLTLLDSGVVVFHAYGINRSYGDDITHVIYANGYYRVHFGVVVVQA